MAPFPNPSESPMSRLPKIHPDSPPPPDNLFLWRTARTIQSGNLPRARAMARHALRTGVDRAHMARALIGEVCQSGRATTRIHSDRAPATSEFRGHIWSAPRCKRKIAVW
ncbi:hypothetical protein Thi970DRAFT_00249 [Thiorhodovibrio frisius]|uniref:Uncharacterized protein n=1 Tax=Thiorhodovibrio frisius TaxID=631362 RepID=H8YVV3_9GAMM|nr:hypothetical protein Thi970DRAFT_00249 [Thiorhodovibrio frisius]WPL20150.1 hypothetical protein Thiofri_00212 [Thiorhodovibrio frisius]